MCFLLVCFLYGKNDVVFDYSDLPNNRSANVIIFLGKSVITTLLGPELLLIYDIFPSKPDFHLHRLIN